jgi:hypothetical protein
MWMKRQNIFSMDLFKNKRKERKSNLVEADAEE